MGFRLNKTENLNKKYHRLMTAEIPKCMLLYT